MFNIGAQGQVLMGAGAAAIIGFKATLPGALLLLAALATSVVIGGIWAGIAGYLKAKTGANEVIVTIMLNWIATWLAAYLLTTQFMREGHLNRLPHRWRPMRCYLGCYPNPSVCIWGLFWLFWQLQPCGG